MTWDTGKRAQLKQPTSSPARSRFATQLGDLAGLARTSGRAILFCHQNADPDSACSALALAELLEQIVPEVKAIVVSPQGMSAPTRQLIRNLGLNLPDEEVTSGKIGLAVLVDTNNLAQLGDAVSGQILESGVPLILVDHHHRHPDIQTLVTLEITDSTSSSTAEIVAELYTAAGKKMDIRFAHALLAAMFTETRSFTLANARTFQIASYLATSGADLRILHSLLGAVPNRPERIARLKAASRLSLETMSEWLVVSAEVGSYQSSVARAFLTIGADLAIVAGMVKGVVRVSLRSTDAFLKGTGIHLGRDLAIPLGADLHGSGGGHPTAAGMTVTGTPEEAIEACARRLGVLGKQ